MSSYVCDSNSGQWVELIVAHVHDTCSWVLQSTYKKKSNKSLNLWCDLFLEDFIKCWFDKVWMNKLAVKEMSLHIHFYSTATVS